MRLLAHLVERRLRKWGLLKPDEALVASVQAELISAYKGPEAVSDGERLTVLKLHLPLGMPVVLGYSQRVVFVHSFRKNVWAYLVDLVQLAEARHVEAAEIEVFFVADPPRRYRLKLANTALAVAMVNELMELRRARLAAQTEHDQALFILQEGDTFRTFGELHRAAAAYETVAVMDGVPKHSSAAALNYAIFLRQTGAEDDAERFFTQALETGNDEVAGKAAMNLAYICVQRGDLHAARRHWKTAVSYGHERADEALQILDDAERESRSPE